MRQHADFITVPISMHAQLADINIYKHIEVRSWNFSLSCHCFTLLILAIYYARSGWWCQCLAFPGFLRCDVITHNVHWRFLGDFEGMTDFRLKNIGAKVTYSSSKPRRGNASGMRTYSLLLKCTEMLQVFVRMAEYSYKFHFAYLCTGMWTLG